jgi:hypothetical protein
MKGSEFVRKLKTLGEKQGISVLIEQRRGKGEAMVHYSMANDSLLFEI